MRALHAGGHRMHDGRELLARAVGDLLEELSPLTVQEGLVSRLEDDGRISGAQVPGVRDHAGVVDDLDNKRRKTSDVSHETNGEMSMASD